MRKRGKKKWAGGEDCGSNHDKCENCHFFCETQVQQLLVALIPEYGVGLAQGALDVCSCVVEFRSVRRNATKKHQNQ